MVKIKKIASYDGLELKEATFKDKIFPTHFHDTYSIGIIKNGIENIFVNENNLVATPKSIVIFNQHELHANSFYNQDAWTYQTLSLNIDTLNYIDKANGNNGIKNYRFENLITDDYLYNLIESFHHLPCSNANDKVGKIVNHLIANHQIESRFSNDNYAEWKNTVLDLKSMMQEQFQSKISIQLLAQTLKKSSFQLIRAFKAHTGLTPIAYLTLIRLNKSKELLTANHTIVDTALECGFFDQSHFANAFKKYFGISPKQYSDGFSLITED